MALAHQVLLSKQQGVQMHDGKKPLTFKDGELVLITNHQKKRGEMGKQVKYLGLYCFVQVFTNHKY